MGVACVMTSWVIDTPPLPRTAWGCPACGRCGSLACAHFADTTTASRS